MEYLAQYENFLIKNAAQITSFESSLRSLTYILPGRFHDAEFASQAVYAALNLVGLYHNSILRRAAQQKAKELKRPELAQDSTFNKYLLFWQQRSKWNHTASTILSILAYTQVLIEMGVRKKWGKRAQWKIIAFLEAFKVLLRLGLLKTTEDRMTLSPTHLQRDVDPASLETKTSRTGTYQGERTGQEWPSMKTSFALDQRDKFDDINAFLMTKVLTPEKLRQPPQMTHVLSGLGNVGEILYILRPLIYVLCILKYGQRSWKPWIISLAAEIGSQLALRKAFISSSDGRNIMMPLENQEMSRRVHLIWFNFVRGAFYSRITRPKLEQYCNRLESKPILKLAAGVLRDYLPLWENIYFYTSSS
ncbi:peroxisome membrane protein [Halteromyces radiatus]|uniref:peroxisome membrane protein n=1 Tax=Halteromyces radiatus TaxID=101107 RepID=UPI00221E4BCA|nr:peroxisome membrane protein [Halteromyces radiatus]KAI8099761.1 peroxisome membrane protein [Halteromyces radiatus]